MNLSNIPELNNIALNISLMALNQNKNDIQTNYNLGAHILKTAIEVNSHLHQTNSENKHDLSQDILKAFVKCNRLMAYIIQAFHRSEITKEEYLHFEIQLKDLMSRLEIAIERIG
jgi:hypothetical protein